MLTDYDEQMRRKRREDLDEAIRDSASSGAITGAAYGGLGKLLSGGRSAGSLLKGAALGAAAYAPTAAGTTALGSAVMGAPEEDDSTAFTTRGLVGGLLGGGAIGAATGGLLGAGRLRGLSKLPFASKIAEIARKELPLDNLLIDKLKHWARNPGAASSGKSAALLGALLGGGAGATGASEGMQLDFARNLGRHQDEDQEDYSVR